MVVGDIGANVGFYTLQIADWVGSTGRVLAFEPDPVSFRLLASRLNAAPCSNVAVYPLALGDRRARGVLHASAYNRADNRLSASHTERHVETFDVQIATLDDFLPATPQGRFDALKVDVQGYEGMVLQGARQTIGAGLRWAWIEFSPDHLRGAGQNPVDFLEDIAGLGMDLLQVGEDGSLSPIPDRADHTNRIGSGYGDIVLVSPEWWQETSQPR
jgi:FkbM family methyltransferase